MPFVNGSIVIVEDTITFFLDSASEDLEVFVMTVEAEPIFGTLNAAEHL